MSNGLSEPESAVAEAADDRDRLYADRDQHRRRVPVDRSSRQTPVREVPVPQQQSVRDGSQERRARQQLEQRHRVSLPAGARHRHEHRDRQGHAEQAHAIIGGESIEWSPVATSDGKGIAFFHSDARRPERAAIQIGSQTTRDLAPQSIPAEFPERALVEPQQVIFDSADGMKIHGQLFVPANLDKTKRHPAVLFFHGGSRRQMLLGWHYNYYYRNAYAMNQYLANHGYIVLSVNYRSGIGYGMEFREALNYGATGGSEFNDVMGAGVYMRNRSDVDPLRIGLWGGSYGGYLTALGLARASDLFAAGVDMHGVHDWNLVIRNFVPGVRSAGEA